VFIGAGMDEEAIASQLDSALLSPEEMAKYARSSCTRLDLHVHAHMLASISTPTLASLLTPLHADLQMQPQRWHCMESNYMMFMQVYQELGGQGGP
jgi:hypothetical protein